MKENERICKVKTVISATKFYLVAGIVCLLEGIVSTSISAYEIFINKDYIFGVIIFIFILALYLGIRLISFYLKREEFMQIF